MTDFEEKLKQIVEKGDRETAEEWLRLIEKEYRTHTTNIQTNVGTS